MASLRKNFADKAKPIDLMSKSVIKIIVQNAVKEALKVNLKSTVLASVAHLQIVETDVIKSNTVDLIQKNTQK